MLARMPTLAIVWMKSAIVFPFFLSLSDNYILT